MGVNVLPSIIEYKCLYSTSLYFVDKRNKLKYFRKDTVHIPI